jgi:hypothetical protein
MNENEKTRLKNAETNVKRLEKRVIALEEEMALCLKFMRMHAEKLAKEKDPTFKVHENVEA